LGEIDAIREGQARQQLAIELLDAGDVGHLGDARLVVFGIVVAPRLRLPLFYGPHRGDAAVEVVAGDIFRGMAIPAYLGLILRQHRDDGLQGHARRRARAGLSSLSISFSSTARTM